MTRDINKEEKQDQTQRKMAWKMAIARYRSGGLNRKSGSENIQLDFALDPKENVEKIFSYICTKDEVEVKKRIGYLNAFVKLVGQLNDHSQLGYSKEDLFLCLRPSLVHGATRVRAAGLRATRCLVQSKIDSQIINKLQIPFLIARSLDLSFKNKMERLEALRLMRRLLAVNPGEFSLAFVRSLISLANGAGETKDQMLRPSLATLCEICILNPFLFLKCYGISSVVRNILDCGLPRVIESLVSCLLFLLDRPDTRAQARVDLQSLAEPYCDFNFSKDRARNDKEGREREVRLHSSHVALLSILRSWPGLMHFCSPYGNSGLRALVNILYLKQLDTRKAVMDLLYDLLGIPLPEWTDEFSVALDAIDPSHPQDSWRLNEGFVAAEGRAVLPHLSKYRPNIITNHLSLLLHAFLEAGLLSAIVEVVVAEDTFLSVRATILLGQLLHLMHLLLPPECSNVTPPLPTLMWYIVGASPSCNLLSSLESDISSMKDTQGNERMMAALNVSKANQQQALTAVEAMNQLHQLLKRRPAPASLFLAQILNSGCQYRSEAHNAAQQEAKASTSPGGANVRASRRRRVSESVLGLTNRGRSSKSKLQQMIAKESEEALKQSRVLTCQDEFSWNWDIIRSILSRNSEALLKLEDSNHRSFIKRLVHYYKPSNNRFSRVELGGNRRQTNKCTLAGIELIDLLLRAEEIEGRRLLEDLLGDIFTQIEATITSKSAHDCLFSPQHTTKSLCQDYFLFIGHLCQSNKGLAIVESTGILSLLLKLVTSTNHDCYIKLVVSSLDYAAAGQTRHILETALKKCSDSSRLYATQFLVVLLRARVPGFHEWGLSLLLGQLTDNSKAVRLAALTILDEACDEEIFLQALAKMQPSFNLSNERELLLQIRVASVSVGFAYLQQSGFISAQLDYWANEFNYRYVLLVEGEIHDSLSLHQRGDDGHYTRRVTSAKHCVKDIFVPPHLYGQLIQLPQGYSLLLQDGRIESLFKILSRQQCSTDQEILELKMSLWAVGHVATSTVGLVWLEGEGVIRSLTDLAQNCVVYSVRATAFYVLGLVATTSLGCEKLAQAGWMGVRHHRHERWPVIHQNLVSNYTQDNSASVDDDTVSQTAADEDESESETSVVTEDDSLLWDDSASRNGVQFWNEASPSPGEVPQRKSRTLPHERSVPEYSRKQQRSLSECQSSSPRISFKGTLSSAIESTPLPTEPSLTIKTASQDTAISTTPSTITVPTPRTTDWSKSRSDSCTDSSTSGVSSCESTVVKQIISERVQTLSPIPSSTSLNTLKSTVTSGVFAPLVTSSTSVLQKGHIRRTSLQGSFIPEHLSPTHSLASARLIHRDVAGYATLRLLRRPQTNFLVDLRRENFLDEFHLSPTRDRHGLPPLLTQDYAHFRKMGHHYFDDFNLLPSSSFREKTGTSSLLSSMRRLKVRSLDRQSTNAIPNFSDKISEQYVSPAPVTESSLNQAPTRNYYPKNNQCYMGVCLPISLSMVFPKQTEPRSKHFVDTEAFNSRVDAELEKFEDNQFEKRESEIKSVMEAVEYSDLPPNSPLSSESEVDFEIEEGGESRLDREGKGRGSRRSNRSSRSGRGIHASLKRVPVPSGELTYPEMRIYSHQHTTCLNCSLRHQQHTSSGILRTRKISTGSYYTRTRTETESSCGTTDATESPPRQRTLSSGVCGGSIDSTSSIDTSASAQDSSATNPRKSKAMVRAEVLRYVELMSNPLWVKECKQGILQAKQKYPHMLDDVCLYSDVCESLASSSYILPVRGFLQEIFLDMSFTEFYEESANILKIRSSSGSVGESQHNRSLSSSLPSCEALAASDSLNATDVTHPPPLSMVLEELSGSEGKRGSCSSSAPGSSPMQLDIKLDIKDIKIHQENARGHTKQHSSLVGAEKLKTVSDDENRQRTPDQPDQISNSGAKVDSPVNNATVEQLPQKKTVFSLLSQSASSKIKANELKDQGMCIKSNSANGENCLTNKEEESLSPVHLIFCHLESGSESVSQSHGGDSDSGCTSESPTRKRKVAALCQPGITVLQNSSQPHP